MENKTTRIIIRESTFYAFCKELMRRKNEYPNAKLETESCFCGDRTRHDIFMFQAVLISEEEVEEKCQFDEGKKGCSAKVCYSGQKCNARDEDGNPRYQ